VTVTSKSGQFIADETGKGQFLRGNRRNLAGEGVVRKISSPRRVASVPKLRNGRGQWTGNVYNLHRINDCLRTTFDQNASGNF